MFCSSRSLYFDGSSLLKFVVLSAAMSSLVSFLMCSVSFLSLLRKGLLTCMDIYIHYIKTNSIIIFLLRNQNQYQIIYHR